MAASRSSASRYLKQLDAAGQESYEWLGHFLIEHSRYDHPDIPDSIVAIVAIGAGDKAPLVEHYFDVRGIARVYQMSLADGVWRQWRDAPGFSQHFTGTFSEDGQRITGRYEKSSDGVSWETDFDIIYTKADTTGL